MITLTENYHNKDWIMDCPMCGWRGYVLPKLFQHNLGVRKGSEEYGLRFICKRCSYSTTRRTLWEGYKGDVDES